MQTEDLITAMQDAFYENDALSEAGLNTRTFEEAGVLTHNEGLVLRLNDGTEFQVTVVQSR
jgi:hypothetical protein